jgi:hypothetical protein
MVTTRMLLTAILVVVAAGSLIGCKRRSREVASPPAPEAQDEQPTAGATAAVSDRGPMLVPVVPLPGPEASPAVPGVAAAVPLDPLWDNLEAGLAELDRALVGLESWEVAVP